MKDCIEMKPGMMSEEAMCLASAFLGNDSHRMKNYAKHKGTVSGAGLNIKIAGEKVRFSRSFVLVENDNGKRISYLWADSKTGTLYKTSGECLTSPNLRIAIGVRVMPTHEKGE